MSDTPSNVERYADALGDVVLVVLAGYVLVGQDWLITNGYGDTSNVLALILVVLAALAILPDIRDLFRTVFRN